MAVKYDGKVWEFDTPAEAAEFQRSLTTPVAPPRPTGRHRKRGRPGRPKGAGLKQQSATKPTGPSLSDSSRRMLEVLRGVMAPGIGSEDYARAIGSERATAIPVRIMTLRKELKGLGLRPDDVIHRDKIYVKGRAKSLFNKGPRLDDALRHNGNLFAGR